MSQTNISIRMDKELKEQLTQFCEEVGLNVSTAFNIFAHTVVQQRRIPFEIGLSKLSQDTIAALVESEKMLCDQESPSFSTVEELMKDLNDEI